MRRVCVIALAVLAFSASEAQAGLNGDRFRQKKQWCAEWVPTGHYTNCWRTRSKCERARRASFGEHQVMVLHRCQKTARYL